MIQQPYFWLGREAADNREVIETYERLRFEEAELERVLPDMADIQSDE